VYAWFFWILNFASLIATVANPLILEHVGPQLAFGLPGIFMIISAIVIWAARRELVHVRPAGRRYLAELFSRENRGSLGGVIVVFAILAVPFGVVDGATSIADGFESLWRRVATCPDFRVQSFAWDAAHPGLHLRRLSLR
jgi:dipeptide/tripeptide permease